MSPSGAGISISSRFARWSTAPAAASGSARRAFDPAKCRRSPKSSGGNGSPRDRVAFHLVDQPLPAQPKEFGGLLLIAVRPPKRLRDHLLFQVGHRLFKR